MSTVVRLVFGERGEDDDRSTTWSSMVSGKTRRRAIEPAGSSLVEDAGAVPDRGATGDRPRRGDQISEARLRGDGDGLQAVRRAKVHA
jgi:hypothetical protein